MITESQRSEAMDRFLANRSKANRDAVIALNMGLIYGVMGRFRMGHGNSLREDSLQEGVIGLVKAVETFNPDNGTFSAWAWKKISAAVQIGMEREVRQSQCRTVGEKDRSGRGEGRLQTRRVELPMGDEDTIPDMAPSPFENMSRNAARRKIRDVLNTFTLTEREEAIIRDHIVDDVSLETLAPCFGVTKQAMHATKQALLRRIEKKMVAA